MATFNQNPPDIEYLNITLARKATELTQDVVTLQQRAARLLAQSHCAHAWVRREDRVPDGHRTDTYVEYRCDLCGYDTGTR